MVESHSIERDQLERLLALPEERLYLGLGNLLLAEEALEETAAGTEVAIEGLYGLQPESILSTMDHAKQFIADNRSTLYERICVEWDFCSKRSDPDLADDITLVTWLIDAISTVLLQTPLVVATVAVVLVKKGLSSFCECSD